MAAARTKQGLSTGLLDSTPLLNAGTSTEAAFQSSFSRRPSTTTIAIDSELSSRRPSEALSPLLNSAYSSPVSVRTRVESPLLGRSRSSTTPRTAWRNGKGWRRKDFARLVLWLLPVGLLGFVLIHLRAKIDSLLQGSHSQLCPSPLNGRPLDSLSPRAAMSPFHPIATNNSMFSLAISYSTTTCNSFRIRIRRANPSACLYRENQSRDLNEDAETTEWVKKRLGPDTFQLRVDGAERLVVDEPSRYDPDRCQYFFDFALANPGTIWLNGIHFYENFDAYNSQPHHVIRRLLNPLFATPLQLSLCSGSCAPYAPPLLASPPSTFFSPDSVVERPRQLPTCQGRRPIPGAYVPSAFPSFLYPPYQLPQTPTRPSAGFHTWVPAGCTFEHDGLRFRDHTTCLERETKILFIGDSHTRGLYDVMLKRLNGSDEMALTSFKVANKHESIGNLYLEFLWYFGLGSSVLHSLAWLTTASFPVPDPSRDPYLEASFDCEYMSKFTHVVVSTGSHQACYRCPPTTAYVSHMSRIFSSWPRRLAECRNDRDLTRQFGKGGRKGEGGEEDPTFVFVTNPSWYPQKIEEFDCRTQQRLTRWNELATEAAIESGWGVVDAQAMTRAMAVDTRMIDGVHYIKTDAIDPMVDELIQKLGICGNSVGAEDAGRPEFFG
ncbi:hypothetical protein JCM10212_006572 [Sporobolomyces blumeae]